MSPHNMEFRYTIKTQAEITQEMLDVCIQTSLDTLRPSLDGLLSVLMWQGTDPLIFSGDIKYTQSEIIVEMNKPNWTPLMP